MGSKPKILFFSTGDSTRSQMAEGFLRTLAGEQFGAESTATVSQDRSPLAVEVMKEVGVDITELHARNVAQSLKEHFACVVTVCDAPKERFPVWPFTRNIVHWSLVDPETADASPEPQRRAVYRSVRDEIRRTVKEFVEQTLPRLQVAPAR
jgi:arsenate reductase (thioredoxin)